MAGCVCSWLMLVQSDDGDAALQGAILPVCISCCCLSYCICFCRLLGMMCEVIVVIWCMLTGQALLGVACCS